MKTTTLLKSASPRVFVSTVRVVTVVLLLCGLCAITPQSTAQIFPPQGDDITPSMGLFRIIVDPHFRVLMDPTGAPDFFSGYLGYHSADGRMTSPTVVDNMTTIGRSSRNNRIYPFPGVGIPIGAGSWDTVFGYTDYPAIPFVFFTAPANTEEVLTEIRSFILSTQARSDQQCSNADPRVPTVPLNWAMVKAGTFAGVAPRSLGMVQGNAPNGVPGPDFPARSFFDIFVEVSLPPLLGTESGIAFPPGGAILTNDTPLIVTNLSLSTLPPTVIYIHGAVPTAVPLRFKFNNPPYWAAGELFGTLVLAGHGTFTNDCTSEAALAAAVLGPLGTSAPELPVEWPRTNTLCPAPGSTYDSIRTNDQIRFSVAGAGVVYARNFSHTNFPSPINPPPANGTATYTAPNTVVTAEISIDGQTWLPIQATGPLAVKILNTTTGAATLRTFDTEMLQLNLTGNSVFGPIMIRESPTLQSLGKHTIRPVTGGFRISSFFDVFLELSTDQGLSWIPADRAIRVESSAPPAAPGALFITRNAATGKIRLQWLGSYQLQGADPIAGMYSDVTAGVSFDGMISTYDVPTPLANAMFYRLRSGP